MFEKDDIYDLLKQKMLNDAQIAAIPVEENGEPMAWLKSNENLKTTQIEPAMKELTGSYIFVRETVAKMVGEAAIKIADLDIGWQLEVVYGHRDPKIQVDNFNTLKSQLAKENPELSEEELYALTSLYRAPIEVAGHPTGSSVDVQVWQEGELVNMGTKQREFVPDTIVHSPFISHEAWRNRQLLRTTMTSTGLAPYDGEWWHFSYGDKEWASYYRQPKAIYGAKVGWHSPHSGTIRFASWPDMNPETWQEM